VAEQAAAAAVRICQARSPSHRGVQGLSAVLALWAAGGTPVGGGRSGGMAGRWGGGTASQAGVLPVGRGAAVRELPAQRRGGVAGRRTVARRAIHRIGGLADGGGEVGRAAAWLGQFEEKSLLL
jgi:hypothetical protein